MPYDAGEPIRLSTIVEYSKVHRQLGDESQQVMGILAELGVYSEFPQDTYVDWVERTDDPGVLHITLWHEGPKPVHSFRLMGTYPSRSGRWSCVTHSFHAPCNNPELLDKEMQEAEHLITYDKGEFDSDESEAYWESYLEECKVRGIKVSSSHLTILHGYLRDKSEWIFQDDADENGEVHLSRRYMIAMCRRDLNRLLTDGYIE